MIDQRFMQSLADDQLMPPEEGGQEMLLAAGPARTDEPQAFVGTRLNVPKAGQPQPTIQDRERLAVGLLDSLAGALRGAVAQTIGLPGDIRSIIDLIAQEGAEKYLGQRTLPTTEEILQSNMLPPVLKEGVPRREERQPSVETAQEVGTFLPAPGIPEAVVRGGKIIRKAAKRLGPKAAEMSEDYLRRIGGISDIVPSGSNMSSIKPGDELIVQHNLTAENLMNADKLGGLPVPSLAISKAAMPLENFGEITLIAPKEMATPSAKNPVFAADAYTKRFPTIDYSFDRKSVNSLKTVFGNVIDKTPGGNSAFDRLIDDWSNREYSDLMKAKYVSETGQLPQTTNRSDFLQEINKIVYDNPTTYRDWLANFDDTLPSQGVDIKERLFKGFTYSGNRMYRQATLENIVKEMKGGAGKESWDYGAASLRAKVTPKFRTFAQIKAGRDRIIDPSDFEKIKSEANDKYSDLIGRLAEMNVRYDGADAIAEVAETRNLNALNRIYPDISQELKADIASFLNTLKAMPTEYFEIKPQRAVGIDEFKGAIIPKDTPQKAREVLQKNGITEIYEYSTPEERKSLFQKYGKEMFAVAPALPAAATQEENQ